MRENDFMILWQLEKHLIHTCIKVLTNKLINILIMKIYYCDTTVRVS